jgi:hypothetical protein
VNRMKDCKQTMLGMESCESRNFAAMVAPSTRTRQIPAPALLCHAPHVRGFGRACMFIHSVDNRDQARNHYRQTRVITRTYAHLRILMRSVASSVAANFRERNICEVREPPELQAPWRVAA